MRSGQDNKKHIRTLRQRKINNQPINDIGNSILDEGVNYGLNQPQKTNQNTHQMLAYSSRFQRIKHNYAGSQATGLIRSSFLNQPQTFDAYESIAPAIKINKQSQQQQVKKRRSRRRHSHVQVSSSRVNPQSNVFQEDTKKHKKLAVFLYDEQIQQKRDNFLVPSQGQTKIMNKPSQNKHQTQNPGVNRQATNKPAKVQQQFFFEFFEQSSNKEVSQEFIPISEPKRQKQDILQPNQQIILMEKYLKQHIVDINRCFSRESFIFNPLPLGSRIIFQAHIYNTPFDRQYTLWLVGENQKTILLRGKKTMGLMQDQFKILQYVQEQRNVYAFAANLVSNFNRRQFTLNNQTGATRSKQKRIYANYNFTQPFIGNTILHVYYPEINQVCNNQIKNTNDNISNKQDWQVSQLVSFNLPDKVTQKAMKQHKLVKTKKTIALKNNQDTLKLFIGKVQSKMYRLIVGSGVSPLIAFGTLIVMIQT